LPCFFVAVLICLRSNFTFRVALSYLPWTVLSVPLGQSRHVSDHSVLCLQCSSVVPHLQTLN
jgi:hypothetical protein